MICLLFISLSRNKKKKGGGKGQEKEGKAAQAANKKGQEGGKTGPSATQVGVKGKPPGEGKHEPPAPAPSEHGLKAMQSNPIERPESHGTAGSEPQDAEGGK